MKKKLLAVMLASVCVAASFTGCKDSDKKSDTQDKSATQSETKGEENDTEKKATPEEVAALIDAIYVQERTENTDKQCEDAKRMWDKLTDEEKQKVEGENADPDYFGRDTGDASKDDARNADDIGDNEILVVSFGTSFNNSRVEDIKGIEDAIQDEYKDWSVRRAFTSQIIINHVQARDGEKIDNVTQALERAVDNKVKNLIILPTHLMYGAEFDELKEVADKYIDKFDKVVIAKPLLGEVGNSVEDINEDKKAVAEAVTAQAVADSKYETLDEVKESSTAFVYLGHGTSHIAKVSYSQMSTQFGDLGYDNVYVGTVEGEPEGTSCEDVIEQVKKDGYKNVILRPMMVVAGDHAENDMAGEDDDSWKSMFEASKAFDSVDVQIAGLGRIKAIKDIYLSHVKAAMVESGVSASTDNSSVSQSLAELKDGTYTASFTTDSSMFHVNEACNGKGTLTVKDNKATIHISLTSKNILNLYVGKAEDAAKEGAELLNPTIDTVTYSDGTTEEVHGFDVPVSEIGKDFDLAIIGTKGKWYDHTVSVSDVAASIDKEDGEYEADVTLSGGSGKTTVESPAKIVVKNGNATATIVFSSKNYDYVIVDGVKYTNEAENGENSTFTIPVKEFGVALPIIGNTTAMSKPHEIEYTIMFEIKE